MKVSTEIDNNFGYEKNYAAGRQYPFKVCKTYWKYIYSKQNSVCIFTPVEIKITNHVIKSSMRCLKEMHAQQYGYFYNEFILKIKSRDNRLLNIHDLMNKNKK